MVTMMQMRSGRGSTAMSRELDEIRLLNKKNHQQEHQRKEEEEKQKKDEAAKLDEPNDDAIMTVDAPTKTHEGTGDEDILNFLEEVHNIMNGVEAMDTEISEEDAEECSPRKKWPGSSKVSSRQSSTTARRVSPLETKTAPVLKPAICMPPFDHKYKRTIVELAILITSEKKFDEFAQALMAFLANAQMVDPKFVINPLNPKTKAKDIVLKGDISPNMMKLGEHIKISGNGPNVFNKRKKWDKEDGGHNSRKTNKKEEFQDPMVYFSMFVSS